MLAWLLACAGGWTEERALSPALAALDVDHDGRVTTAEIERVNLKGSPFEEIDTDADGVVTNAELVASMSRNDPILQLRMPTGKGTRGARGKAGARASAGPNGKSETRGTPKTNLVEQRRQSELEVRLVLESLREEVRWVEPTAELISDDTILTATLSGSLNTAESRAALASLERASDAAKLAFPPSLRAAELAHVPVSPTLPPLPGPPQRGFMPNIPGDQQPAPPSPNTPPG